MTWTTTIGGIIDSDSLTIDGTSYDLSDPDDLQAATTALQNIIDSLDDNDPAKAQLQNLLNTLNQGNVYTPLPWGPL